MSKSTSRQSNVSSRHYNYTSAEIAASSNEELTADYHDCCLFAMEYAAKGNFEDAEYYFRKARAFREIVQRRLQSSCAKHQFAIDALQSEIDNIRDFLDNPGTNFRFKSNFLTRIAIVNGINIPPRQRPHRYEQYLSRLVHAH